MARGARRRLGTAPGRSTMRYRENKPGDLDRARAGVRAWDLLARLSDLTGRRG